MSRVLTCLATEHDWRLVGLAVLLCFVASLAAIRLFRRAIATSGATRAAWIVGAGAVTGFGIWATHFIAMLSYEPGIATGYQLGLTALSLVAAMALTTMGIAVAVHGPPPWGAFLGGGIIGTGVAVMHYTGMAALKVPGHIVWSHDLVVVSVALGIALRGGGARHRGPHHGGADALHRGRTADRGGRRRTISSRWARSRSCRIPRTRSPASRSPTPCWR